MGSEVCPELFSPQLYLETKEICGSYLFLNKTRRALALYLRFLLNEVKVFVITCIICNRDLPIGGRLLDHRRTEREEVIDMMVTLLDVDPSKVVKEATDTRGAYVMFSFLEKLYRYHL